MPVELQSPSPEPFERSPSPDYGSRGGANGAGPSKVRGTRFTEHDIQKRKVCFMSHNNCGAELGAHADISSRSC